MFSNKIDSVKNLITLQSISKTVRDLSGDTIANIGGSPYRIYSRYWGSPSNPKAAQYIYEKFQSYGLNVRYQNNSNSCVNVIAEITGSTYPDQYYIICAHYDNFRLDPVPGPFDTIPGADDNTSGIAGVLETARLLSTFPLKYSVLFIAFDEEEKGLVGSFAFVDSAFNQNMNIKGVLNLEVMGYDSNNDGKYTIVVNSASNEIADYILNAVSAFQIGLTGEKNFNGGISDHYTFWLKNFKAVTYAQSDQDFTPYEHTRFDTYDKFNQNYFLNMTKGCFVTLASLAADNKIKFTHTPVQSSPDTASRFAISYIKFPVKMGSGSNSPRLYYKINNGSFNYINSVTYVQDTFKFSIPGYPQGTKITYYLAAQDSAGTVGVTLPAGGSGVNPPGTTPPTQFFSYYILSTANICSNTVPKQIIDIQEITDTINIVQTGIVTDVNVLLNVTHSNVGQLMVRLSKAGRTSILSQYNGTGGQNFVNTYFDDSAAVSILQGNPPYTGSFRPQSPLNIFNTYEMSGKWVLRIFDNQEGNGGSLTGWCIIIKYGTSIGINNATEIYPDKFRLEQNYPNPFNSSTKISYSIPETQEGNRFISLKVYNVLGKEVQTLVNEEQTPGNYFAVFKCNSFPSGVYFYSLFVDGLITDTKKMMIIK